MQKGIKLELKGPNMDHNWNIKTLRDIENGPKINLILKTIYLYKWTENITTTIGQFQQNQQK